MKGKISIALFILLTISALAFYVFAQSQPEKLQEQKQQMVRRMLLIENNAPIKDLILLLSRTRGDGTADFLCCPIPIPSTTLTKKQKVRIEMLDGSFQEINLKKIKKMTVE